MCDCEPLESRAVLAALTLPAGTSYSETFDGIGTALPVGWTVATGATATSRGTAVAFTTTATAWGDTAGRFKNLASADGGTSADTSTAQNARSDRALGIKQSGSVGDPGAAFELELAGTSGTTGFGMSVKHQMLDVQARSTTWSVQYSTTGSSWTTVATYADPGAWGSTTGTYSFGSALDNLAGPVFVRIAALSATSGSGSRDAYGIDDVALTWTNASSPSPAILQEDFASLTAGGTTATSGTGSPSGTEVTANLTPNFPTSAKAYSAGGAVKLGTSSLPGSITSKTLDLSGNGGAFTVSFDVKGWTTVEGDITVTVTGLAPQTVSYAATVASAFETKVLQFTGGQAASTITFATTAKRAFLDNVVVTGGDGPIDVVPPSAPAITGITPASGRLTVAFSPPSSNGGATITNYQYSLDGGGSWVAPAPAVTTSPLVITGLVNGQTYSVRLRAVNAAGPGAASAAVTGKPGAIDYLRIVSYNVTAADIAGVRTGFETLVQGMAAEAYAGHVDRVDLIAMQEVKTQATTSADLAARLNAVYGAGSYAHGVLDGATTGSGTQGVVFNTAALQLLEEVAIGTVSSTGIPRQTLRYKFQPVGGDATSVFYVYNSHLKAADDSESAARRAADAQMIRADADALGPGTSVLYVGDFNLQTSNEQAYQNFLAAGNGQAFDPLNRPGNWSNNSAFRDIFTQAPSANPPTGFAGGGLDDRYDFQLVSGPVMAGGGLAYKTGSYRTFGVDGSVAAGGSVNDPTSTALSGLSNRTQLLDLLTTVADHLPVVVDYSYLAVGQPTSPTITVSPGTLAAALTTTVGTPSAAQTFTVSGAALTGSLIVTAPTGLEVSLAAGSGYATSLSLAPTAGSLAATTVYVRLAATAAAGNYNAAAITVSGGGATARTVLTTASGNVVSPASSTTLFFEDFAALTAGDNTTTTGSGTVWTGSSNWSSVTGAFQAGGAVRLGTGSAAGSITTRTLDLSGNAGVFTVSFDVKGWTTVAGPVTVTVAGLSPQTVAYSAIISSAFERKTLQFTGGQPNVTITFSVAAGQRAFLDDIQVSGGTPEPVVTGIAGFVWNDADGDGVWDTPGEAGIPGRTVYLDLDRNGLLGVGEPNTVTAADGGYSFTGLAAGTYIVAQIVPAGWEQTFPAIAVAAAQVRSASGVQVATITDPAYAPADRQQAKRFVPNDPLFTQQWHLRNTGQQSGTSGQDANVVTAWDAARGAGVVIGIVDDGLQYTHPDLSPAYRADLSYDFNDDDSDAAPGAGDDHGTAVAGVAAARGNNGIGVSGTAPSASVAGIRLTAGFTSDQEEAAGLTHEPQAIAVYSNSWGPSDDGTTLEAPGPLTLAAFANAVQTGRGGKGSIYVWAAGNGLDTNDNSNYDGYANSRYTIAVTAVDNRGKQSWYAEPGANILVAAPSSGDSSGTDVGVVTTDRTGVDGYNISASESPGNLSDRSYTNDFSGTSSATPVVSGVVALMLEANPNLGWRDVQHVLAGSARRNDAADPGWTQNGAGKWVNHKYGFGVVDAAAAVSLAKTWTNVGAEVSAGSGTITVGQTIPDNNAAGITSSFTLGADIRMESVEVVFSAAHTSRGHLQVVLTSPAGTKSVLAERHADTGDNYSGWVFSTVRNWGESSKGAWTLTVSDLTSGTTGTFGSWALNVYGTTLVTPPGAISVTVAAGQTASAVNFGSRSADLVFDVADGQTVTDSVNRSGPINIVKRGLGTLVLSGASGHTGQTTVEAGTLVVAAADALAASPVRVATGGTLKVNSGITMRSPTVTLAGGTLDGLGATLLVDAATGIGTLAIVSGAVTGAPSLAVSGNGVVTLPTDRRQVVALTALTVDQAGGGRIDIGKGRLDIATGATETDLRADLMAGRHTGAFNGTSGIMTTGGKASTNSANPVVGYRVTGSSAVVAWAAYGDANLDGLVNSTDISLINGGGRFNQVSSVTWAQGDFNYSNGVNSTDISLLNGTGLFGSGSYLPVTPVAAQSTSTTGSTAISQDAWIAYAIDAEMQKSTKR
ncbi:MAG: S8 family serine peptidase, partial [Planctomycetaceae bacterium]